MFIQDRKWYLEATGNGPEKEIYGDINRSAVDLAEESVHGMEWAIKTLETFGKLREAHIVATKDWIVWKLDDYLYDRQQELEKAIEADRLLEEMSEGEYLAAKTKAMEEHIATWGEKAA